MAARYSGNVELRIALKWMRGWSGKMGWFYTAHLYLPGYSAEAVLSPREAGVRHLKDLASPEAYDQAARAFLELGNRETRGLIKKEAVRRGGEWEILRVEQSPCPLEES
jgi:hypothetical protein